ncbi:hypothetical protein NQ315_012660 [Exocentrus adspersus]|uniref:Uncharacterized protein n=1 Tax=Exocentrus adspersus TaxID=1586481 RepID=A0AAV8VSD0_9CUCU|nr:hypothetical protein NQ315_012660 [Exocentrus adspersus]
MYRYLEPIDADTDNRYFNHYQLQGSGNAYSTLPSKKTQFFTTAERSVTPDITRGLERVNNYQHSLPRNFYKSNHDLYNQKLGIPVQLPDVGMLNLQNQAQGFNENVSPIDPRHCRGFQSSTPSSKLELKAAANLMSPKKSTMSNEELYAVIHKSKKRMNIETEQSPVAVETETLVKQQVRSPETGYLADKTKSRLSWSPNKGEYMDFNADIDKLSPKSRQSWACSDRKGPKTKQTSTIDFKRLLLQKSSSSTPKKISAVEQLKLSKQQMQTKPPPEMNILDLSGSPRSLVNRRLLPGSPSREAPKILSPRSQWRFASPRSDVLSSTILEDCREDESPNSSGERRASPKQKPALTAAQRLQAQRAQFFASPSPEKPTLETAF